MSKIAINPFILENKKTGPEDIELFSYSSQLRIKFQLLIKTEYRHMKKLIAYCFKSLRCCIYHAYKC